MQDKDLQDSSYENSNNNNNNIYQDQYHQQQQQGQLPQLPIQHDDLNNSLDQSFDAQSNSSQANLGWIIDNNVGKKSPTMEIGSYTDIPLVDSSSNNNNQASSSNNNNNNSNNNISNGKITSPPLTGGGGSNGQSLGTSGQYSPPSTLSRAPSSTMSSSGTTARKSTKSSSLRSNKPKKKPKALKKAKKKKYIGTSRNIFINQQDRNVQFKYTHNKISTTKYTPWSFLPKNLYEQFRRAANFYFLVIAVIQLIPGISPVNAYTTWIPLIFVLAVTAVKEGIEDIKRNQSDKTVNNLDCRVLRNGKFEMVLWKEVKVGDILQVNKGERFPADLVILNSSEQHGVCYIETSNLDGETNLKQRQAIPQTFEILRSEEDLAHFRGNIECEHPNNVIYVYNGAIQMTDESPKHPLNNTQTLLRGCLLRNTEWIYGVAVYTGEDTKLMQNSTDAPSKRSTLEKLVNRALINLFIIMFVVCVVGMIVSVILTSKNIDDQWYLDFSQKDVRKAVLNLFSFMIAFAVMIPISLYVSLELVKVAQAVYVGWDIKMYHAETNTPARTRTSNLSEELGQIEYIFSDKTGTLTRNQMDFLKCSVGKMVYGNMEKEDDVNSIKPYGIEMQGIIGADPSFFFKDRRIITHLDEDKNSEQSFLINEFLTLLAVCHSVVPDRPNKDDSEIIYEASSPDEAALVTAAKNLGYAFYNRDPTGCFVNIRGKIERFEVLNVLEFNSDRKRMSVICRNPQGRIILYCKGADTTVLPLLRKDQEDLYSITLEFLQDFAADGLRTLCLAYTYLEEEDYQQWNELYKEAAIAIQDRDVKVDKVSELIERNLSLIGSTAIEDKLQEGVPLAIANLVKANIKVWVLTGDKQETAINIGFSCHLLTPEMRIIILNGNNQEDVQNQIQGAIDAYFSDDAENTTNTGFALVVEGSCLNFALEGELKTVFLQLASNCRSVICCRTTPLQKALVVKMVRDTLRAVTLAIGDGANDVSMIQAAHIGVGISGHEGMQAVMASDYSIAQFSYLYRLLIVHGRWNYKRNCRLLLYCFYKNFVFAMTQFWFGIYNQYSAQTMFDSWSISIFNVVFTGLPIIVCAIFDQDVSAESAMKYPQLYASGQKDSEFNLRVLWAWIIEAFVHSVVIFFGVYGLYNYGSTLLQSGNTLDLWAMGQNIFIVVVITVNFKLAFETRYWTWITHFSIWGSILIWFIWVAVLAAIPGIGSTSSGDIYAVAYKVFASPLFWLSIFVLPVICLTPDVIYKYIQRDLKPYSYQIVQEIEKLYGKPSDIMSKENMEKYNPKSNDIEEMGVESPPLHSSEKRKKKRAKFLTWMKSIKTDKTNTGFAFSHANQNKSNKKGNSFK